jgi:hypothetical protein
VFPKEATDNPVIGKKLMWLKSVCAENAGSRSLSFPFFRISPISGFTSRKRIQQGMFKPIIFNERKCNCNLSFGWGRGFVSRTRGIYKYGSEHFHVTVLVVYRTLEVYWVYVMEVVCCRPAVCPWIWMWPRQASLLVPFVQLRWTFVQHERSHSFHKS